MLPIGISPTMIVIGALVLTNGLTLLGWKVTGASLKAAKKEIAEITYQHNILQAKHDMFVKAVKETGEEAERAAKQLLEDTRKYAKEKEDGYKTDLDKLRAFYTKRMRSTAGTPSANPGSGQVPGVPPAPRSIDEVPANCLSLAEQAGETTLMLIELQDWHRNLPRAQATP